MITLKNYLFAQHHSYRSFQGFVCLMQISTREKDFVVDTIALREELHILNEVFTDSSILKVSYHFIYIIS